MSFRGIAVAAVAALLMAGCGTGEVPGSDNGAPAPTAGAQAAAAGTPILTVPDLTGLVADDVPTTLQASGLFVGPTSYQPSDKPRNTVISQDPPPFTNLSVPAYTTKVTVVVSAGGQGGEPEYTFPPQPVTTNTAERSVARWTFSSGFAPKPSSTELKVDIAPDGCTGGQGVVDPQPKVTYSRSRVTLTISGASLGGGTYTCQGLSEVQTLVVPLSEPLGNRRVVDGGVSAR